MNYCVACGKIISIGARCCCSCAPRVRIYGVEGTQWLYQLIKTNRDTSREELFSFLDKYYKVKSYKKYKLNDLVKSIRKKGYKGNIKNYYNSNNVSRQGIAKRARVILSNINHCQICGKKDCELSVHHIVPVRLGGKSIKRNVIKLCKECHTKVHKNMREILMAHFESSFEFMFMLLSDTINIK